MRKSVIKVLSIIMALCLFITVFPLSVSAEETGMTETESVSMIQFSPETELDGVPLTLLPTSYVVVMVILQALSLTFA